MNRTDFLKAFGLGSTGLVIPKMGLVQQLFASGPPNA